MLWCTQSSLHYRIFASIGDLHQFCVINFRNWCTSMWIWVASNILHLFFIIANVQTYTQMNGCELLLKLIPTNLFFKKVVLSLFPFFLFLGLLYKSHMTESILQAKVYGDWNPCLRTDEARLHHQPKHGPLKLSSLTELCCFPLAFIWWQRWLDFRTGAEDRRRIFVSKS